MPKTFPKRALGVRLEDNPVLSYVARWEPEAANQSYQPVVKIAVCLG